jgi:agmatinase
MPLRIEPLPRMAGTLSFMRGRLATLDAVAPSTVAAFGVPAPGAGRYDLAPLAMRETSAYFGSHFNANMKAAMDVDQRQCLRSAAIAGSVIDLGDLELDRETRSFGPAIQATVAQIRKKGAIPLLLGGASGCIPPAVAGLREGEPGNGGIAALLMGTVPERLHLEEDDTVAVLSATSAGSVGTRIARMTFRDLRRSPIELGNQLLGIFGARPVHVALDASAMASQWHGSSPSADFEGLSLSECRAFLRTLGAGNVASISITGLDPTINGLSLVKTGQRLLLTAILDLVYTRLGVLEPRQDAANA